MKNTFDNTKDEGVTKNVKKPNYLKTIWEWLNAPLVVAMALLLIQQICKNKEQQATINDYSTRIEKLEGDIVSINNSIIEIKKEDNSVTVCTAERETIAQGGSGNFQLVEKHEHETE